MVAIVTDIHYRMSLAVIRDLGEAGVTVICCESDRYRPTTPPGARSRYCKQHHWLRADHYAAELYALCRDIGTQYHCLPALLPVGAATLALVAAEREQFDAVCGLLIPSSEQLALFNSKDRLHTLAASLAVPVPESFSRKTGESIECFAARLPYPCVIKPVCGEKLGLSAAQRYLIADREAEAVRAFSHYLEVAGEDPVVQRRLTGGGLGCSVLAQNGQVIHSICHRRIREYPVSGGPSSCCCCEMREDLRQYAETLVKQTGYSGLAMFEFKEDGDGNPYLLEVNPRIWGTYPLTRVSKSGFSLLWCTLAWNTGNPAAAHSLPLPSEPKPCRMIFAASDVMAAVSYLRKGELARGGTAVWDWLNPTVRDGVWEWNDCVPAMVYFRSLWKKERKR